MARTILIIDDEQSILTSLQGALTDEGYRVRTAPSGQKGLALLEEETPDTVLLDIWMPEMDGLTTLKIIKEKYPTVPVVMMSGHGTIETAVKATKLGAFDFVEKPLSLEKILVLLKNTIANRDLARENQALRKQFSNQKSLLGDSEAIQSIKTLIHQIAPTTGSVLITGENGTGKELVASAIHFLSTRSKKPFVVVNCAAIPDELIESELFGHEKGAFTGATQQRRGKFDLANEGTLFLDEIGDMSLKTQAKILRILQEQKFERVGGSETLSVDVRIVAATNKDLREEIRRGNFREDLFYRLNVIPFHIPALRERGQDVLLIAKHFLKEYANIHGKKERTLTAEGANVLLDYPWPGNVRELKNFIERLMILTRESEDGTPLNPAVLLEHLEQEPVTDTQIERPSLNTQIPVGRSLRDARQVFERDFILKTLREQGGNISKAASVLGVERSHLHRKMKSFGIDINS